MTGKRQEPGRSVTSKLFAVLEAFDDLHTTLNLTGVQARTGLPMSTTLRLLRELVEAGALEQDQRGYYGIGLRLWERAALAGRTRSLREAALPIMHDLSSATGGYALLAVSGGSAAVVLDLIAGSGAGRIKARPAGRLPYHATAIGRVLLAAMPPSEAVDLLTSGLDPLTPYTTFLPGAVLRECEKARDAGYAVVRQEIQIGRDALAVPVVEHDMVVAALGVSCYTRRFSEQTVLPRVREAARMIGARLDDQSMLERRSWAG